jgi:MFS superfamily sulfate permease-like transporter
MIRCNRIGALFGYAFAFATMTSLLIGAPLAAGIAIVDEPSAPLAVFSTFFAGFVVGFWKGVAEEVIGEVKEPDRGHSLPEN